MKEFLLAFFENHKGKTIGILCGLIFGVFILLIGFWRVLLLLLCILLGYWLGSFHDNNESFYSFLNKILPSGIRDKMEQQ
ncbi:MAG: DUF2273 domain-containing protein [Caldicoprobacterales bacterium]|jgi:uncharacterized membrane protein|nr:DUF2273 domain-containing protein [Clostridiales bacterium]